MKKVEDIYKKMSDIEHVLKRPDTYIGSVNLHDTNYYIIRDEKIVLSSLRLNFGLLKIFDEVLINSVDESKRNKKLNKISVVVTPNYISIEDNGGIPIIKSEKFDNKYLPEFIFGSLRTSSNYDDSEQRTVAGTNGIGVKATNIFSNKFIIETCDGQNIFVQEFEENMTKINTPNIKKSKTKNGYTKITFFPDFKRFKLIEIDDSHLKAFEKRIYDIAANNQNIKFSFNNYELNIKDFYNYCTYYDIDKDDFFYTENENWKIGLTTSDNGFQQVSFVNDVNTSEGGTHVDYILNKITDHLKEYFLKKHKLDIRIPEIKSQLFLFLSCNVINNRFNSQTKERLMTEVENFGSTFEFDSKFFKKLYSSKIVLKILEYKKRKDEVNEAITIRKLSKSIDRLKVTALYDCSSTNRSNCELFIFEGQSARTGALNYRNSKTQALFSLKGKITNVNGMKPAKVLQNEELKGLIATLGLDITSQSIKNLRYGKVLITTDADHDGDHICGLLINFFYTYWPDLINQGYLYRVLTPLMVIENGKEKIDIYDEVEFEKFSIGKDLKKYKINYKKGLGALSDSDTKKMIETPRLIQLTKDDKIDITLEQWFENDSYNRKNLIL